MNSFNIFTEDTAPIMNIFWLVAGGLLFSSVVLRLVLDKFNKGKDVFLLMGGTIAALTVLAVGHLSINDPRTVNSAIAQEIEAEGYSVVQLGQGKFVAETSTGNYVEGVYGVLDGSENGYVVVLTH